MADLFKEIVPSILQTKKRCVETEDDEKDYNAYVVNRALSYHLDCVPYANEINMLHFLDRKLQYDYLLNSIRPMKRKFQPWQKAESVKDLECVKEYFGYSDAKAKEALSILTKDQLSYIRKITDKGGVSK
ncbi:MAG: DNA polymerase [Alphaproteobacteria bacterium]|nr:DNA polymerase [Alphaproteobacteria bacterium]